MSLPQTKGCTLWVWMLWTITKCRYLTSWEWEWAWSTNQSKQPHPVDKYRMQKWMKSCLSYFMFTHVYVHISFTVLTDSETISLLESINPIYYISNQSCYDMAVILWIGTRLQRDGKIKRWNRACQSEIQPLNHLPVWLTLLCIWPVISETGTGTIFTSILQLSTSHFPAKHFCLMRHVSHQTEIIISYKQVNQNTAYQTGQLIAYV